MSVKDQKAVARAPMGSEDCGGEWIRMGAVEYRVAPLNFDALERFAPTIEKFGKIETGGGKLPGRDVIVGIAEVVHAAIVRNHPAVTLEEVKLRLDLSNFQDVTTHVLRIGGVKKTDETPPGK